MKRGSGDGMRRGGQTSSVLRALDAFPKVADDFASRTASGGIVTLASLAVMALLFLGELSEFYFLGRVGVFKRPHFSHCHSIDATFSPTRSPLSFLIHSSTQASTCAPTP
jgi:hypothetical protein